MSDGQEYITIDAIPQGATIVAPENPTKASSIEYTYTFDHWDYIYSYIIISFNNMTSGIFWQYFFIYSSCSCHKFFKQLLF